jgi:ssDNA-binding Zn-finger/Zn-ribbon topoisomerase 1
MNWILLIVIVAAVCAILIIQKNKKPTVEGFPYEQRGKLFSAAERSFYRVLCKAAAGNAVVFGKVRVADIVKPTKGLDRGGWQRAFNRIAAKHFDFLLCKPDDLSVISAIELDDGSHGKKKRTERDQFLNGVCEAVGITLHRFKASSGYQMGKIRGVLFPGTEPVIPKPAPEIENGNEEQPSAPVDDKPKQLCPKFSSELVKKVAKKGKHAGNVFMAYSAFPNCRYIAKLKERAS